MGWIFGAVLGIAGAIFGSSRGDEEAAERLRMEQEQTRQAAKQARIAKASAFKVQEDLTNVSYRKTAVSDVMPNAILKASPLGINYSSHEAYAKRYM